MSKSKHKGSSKRNNKRQMRPSSRNHPGQIESVQPQRETIQLGPVTIERDGRVITMRSNWPPEEYKKFISQMKQDRPNLKIEIDNEIQRLAALVQEYDPLIILTNISMMNLCIDPEEYTEITHDGSEAKVELLMSITTAFPISQNPKEVTAEVNQKVSDLLDQILDDTFWYYGSEISETDARGVDREIRQMLLGTALKVRGHAYWSHIKQTFLEMYTSLNEFLSREFGFTAERFLQTLEYAENTITKRLKESSMAANDLKKAHSKFVEWTKVEKTDFSSIDEMVARFRTAHPEISKNMEKAMTTLASLGGPAVLEVIPRDYTDRRIMELIASTLGENHAFFDNLPKWPGWPLNPSLIYEKPIISHGDKFYIFHMPLVLRSIGYLIERLIKNRDPNFFASQFLTTRDEYLEKKSLEILNKLLPRSKIYSDLYYPIVVGDKERWVETDGIILIDGVLIIVEAKAGELSESARRGSIMRLNDNLEEILGKAHTQSLRTLNYIKSSKVAQFHDEKHNLILTIESGQLTDIFMIIVSYEQLTFISAQLSSIQKMGVIKEREWPWAVYLNDLRVISEIIEHPTEFIHYLKCRIPLNDIASFKFGDELDIFMLYLKDGLYVDKSQVIGKTAVGLIGYTQDLDSYYLFRDGARSEFPKPKQQMPEAFESLITILESKRPSGFMEASLGLLNCSEKTRTAIAQNIERMEQQCSRDHKSHSASFIFNDQKTAILLSCLEKDSESRIDEWPSSYIEKKGFKKVIVISWIYPLRNSNITVQRLSAL